MEQPAPVHELVYIDFVSYGNLRTRPDLSVLFGPLRSQENDQILDLLLQIDDRLSALAQQASQHIGVLYKHTGLGLFAGVAGAEIAGGPSGDAGDIWFEIQMPMDESTKKSHAPPWIVDSRIIVCCLEQPDQYCTCTHALAGIRTETNTPVSTVETLAANVEKLMEQVLNRTAPEFTEPHHDALVAQSGASTG
jgi:hypothetical protein